MPTTHGRRSTPHRPRADAASVAIARRSGRWWWESSGRPSSQRGPGPTMPSRLDPHRPRGRPPGRPRRSRRAWCRSHLPPRRPARLCDRRRSAVSSVKPTHGMLPCVGVKAISETVRHGRCDDAHRRGCCLRRRLALRSCSRPSAGAVAARVGICLAHEWDAAAVGTVALFEALPEVRRAPGPDPVALALPPSFAGLVRGPEPRSGRSRSPAVWRTSIVASRT